MKFREGTVFAEVFVMLELTPENQQFIDAQVAIGAFKDPADVIQAGLELLRKTAAQRDYEETVREIREGIPDMEAGRGRTLDEVDRSIRIKLGFPQSS
jgi:Arc/MetJ-type ribon-helix-helix transcriptional regulator